MRKRIFHTPMNLLLELATYQELKRTAELEKTTMSHLIREGIKLKLREIGKKNNAIEI